MKKLVLLPLTVLLLGSCSQAPVVNPDPYSLKPVNVYRNKETPDKTLSLRFYASTPNVPFISVREFYQEFFKSNLSLTKNGHVYKYNKGNAYLKFDTQEDVLTIYDSLAFSSHPDYIHSNTKSFLKAGEEKTTPKKEKVISLKNYQIDIRGDEEVYVPLDLLSSFSGGVQQYNVAYNTKDIFILDKGALYPEGRPYSYYGELYTEPLNDLETPRSEDLAQYGYNQLCFNVDNLRGYTVQTMIGDNNLLSLGLNGALEKYYPEIKTLLLSTNKKEYALGYSSLIDVLYDGGHTGLDQQMKNETFISSRYDIMDDYPDLKQLAQDALLGTMQKMLYYAQFGANKKAAFPDLYKPLEGLMNYYSYDVESKTAYIGFDSFEVNYAGWDKYYNEGMKSEDIPSDSFGFIRPSLYQALSDNANNVILDLSTNGGGNSDALVGIYGLLNEAKCSFEMNNVVDCSRDSQAYQVDINLDGKFDQDDVSEANRFKDLKIAVLTSPFSFSCGNLLPNMLKESGYKIVGLRSGGGSCAVNYTTTVDGYAYQISSFLCLSNGSGDNIDSGVPLDFEVEVSKSVMPSTGAYMIDAPKFYDYVTIASYLDSLE